MVVRFKDLSLPLKIAAAVSWIVALCWVVFFLMGFMWGYFYG